MTAFDRLTGAQVWTAGGSYHQTSPVTVGYGLAVYQAEDSTATNASDQRAIFVRDAATGALKYKVPIGYVNTTPITLSSEPDGSVTAYLSSSGVSAFTLDATSGAAKWTNGDGFSLYGPTAVVGSSVIAASGGVARAYDRATGASTTVYNNGSTGGSTASVTYDAAHGRVYTNGAIAGLNAFTYGGGTSTTPLWSATVHGLGQEPVALADDGTIYAVSGTNLVAIDGATGAVIRQTTTGGFTNGSAPVVEGNLVWVTGSRGDYDHPLFALDRTTLAVIASFPAGDAPDYTGYAPPALGNGFAVVPYVSGVGEDKGFYVYQQVPEPTLLAALVGGALVAVRRRRR